MNLEPFFLGYGVLGVMFLLVLFGWIRPKWNLDEWKERVKVQDATIKELSSGLNRAVDVFEGKVTRT